jgi:predicted NBD/HSP70 family sugar kinase
VPVAGNLSMNLQKVRNSTYRLGIGLGGTKTEVVVLDEENSPVFRKGMATPANDYDAILALLGSLVAEAEKAIRQKLTVGIGAPGTISPRSRLLRNSNIICMNGRAFKGDIEERLQRQVDIQNDTNCFALSEVTHGSGQKHAVVFGVIIGTGTGAGLVVNGQLINGPHAITGSGDITHYPGIRSMMEIPVVTAVSGLVLKHFFRARAWRPISRQAMGLPYRLSR